ncbi:MAG: MFS transporter [Patescibacteria group bacterium]|nr:MFS transporter [Patescibacteria group bacterium]MCL5224424.1 MFS transporter [Patescibacteria group bacterium]
MENQPAAQANPSSKPKNKNPFFIGLLSLFGGISQDIFTPIIPIYYTTVLGFDKTFVGIAEGLVDAGSYIFSVISGLLSDKFKRRKPIIFIGYLFSMVSRPLLAFFTSSASIFGLRFLDGAGKGIKDPPKDVLIAGSSEKETRGKSFGIVRMLDTFGSVAGPLILFGLLYLLSGSAQLYRYILIFTAVPLFFTLLILVTKVREIGHNQPAPQRIVTAKGRSALPQSFYLFMAIVIIFTLGSSSDAFLILRARNLGITLLAIPLVIALFNFIYALFAVPVGSLSDKIGRIPTIIIGWVVYGLVYLGFALASQAYMIWLLYGLYGIYYAIDVGVAKALLADMVSADYRGRAFGIYGMTSGVAALVASFLAGLLWDRVGPSAPFYLGAAAAFVAVVVLMVFEKKFSSNNLQTE